MLTTAERDLIYRYAYVPEHLHDYVQAITGAEPFLADGHLCYVRGRHLVFVGYPLGENARDTPEAYEKACKRFRSATAAITAPRLWVRPNESDPESSESYYRLDLPVEPLLQGVAYMVRRARRELHVRQERFGKDHQRLVEEFLAEHSVEEAHTEIFRNVEKYLTQCPSARLLCARKGNLPAAFDVVDMGSRDYAFYMFNFRSTETRVPGASDLLLLEAARLARAEGRLWLNLGLGINEGVKRFKEKWGGVPFVSYASTVVRIRSRTLLSLLGGS
jgi:hypothetical protein